VINLGSKVVIILAGINDIATSYGHITNQTIMDNIVTMAELAKLHHIKAILCAYLPVYDYPRQKLLH
jgi:lysophospholipase L1-like esterase